MAHRRPRLPEIRAAMRAAILADESRAVRACVDAAGLARDDRASIVARAVDLVRITRTRAGTSIMQGFLAEYGLSTREGVALMCLAEALLRVPDTETIDALIEDKIGASDWGAHLGHSSSPLVNASTWALLLTGKVLGEAEEGIAGALHEAIKRLGRPVIRAAVAQAMRELGHQFVLGRDMREATTRAAAMEARGYTFSYDMLGEAARTEADARRYHLAYSASITALAGVGRGAGVRDRPGVSVKLSALHARYEFAQRDRVMSEVVARLRSLALLAQSAGIGLNVDAEEADRLDLSLDVVEAVLADPALAGWDGFGIVVQAYGKRAPHVVDWLHELAVQLGRRIMVRLVKGGYWDTEVKRAQVLGLDGFPVFTRKAGTDVSYLACARRLLAMTDRIYPQFATHNAHTMAAVLHMAGDRRDFEFQRLHGMGEALHEAVRGAHGTRCRIYAPVGAHHNLLAYLMRRLLENGANSSFVNRIVDENVTPEEIARDPVEVVEGRGGAAANPRIAAPPDLFRPARRNAKGWDLTDPLVVAAIEAERERFRNAVWEAGPPVAGWIAGTVAGAERANARNPARADVESAPLAVGRAAGTIAEAERANVRNPDRTDGETEPLVAGRVAETIAETERTKTRNPARGDDTVRHRGHHDRLHVVRNPAGTDDIVGHVVHAAPADVEAALDAARVGAAAWASTSVENRAARVRRVADLYEAHAAELFELAAREAGKTWPDAVGEVREACDFARFYANEALREAARGRRPPRGVIACISPWNFPLAIFSGQVLAALAAGNAVVAKPAAQTALIAARAVALMHEAGIPRDAVQLLPGDGATIGAALVRDARVDGVCFTGSTETAALINRAMAEHLAPDAPLIAETGGLNAMIVDSTALPEQAVRDIVASAFQSAGQRCSALRILYVQREVEARMLAMLFGAMDELRIGDPRDLATDVGPVIDEEARDRIESYCHDAERDGRVLKRLAAPSGGRFVPPTVLRVDGIEALGEEIFGPVLHVATFDADRIDAVVDAVNAAGYGLTFGVHTRIDDRVQHIVDRVRAGNIYVNRNQIGAVVGSQPFGGEGLSGTGPKAGGPHYVRRLTAGAPGAGGVPSGAVVGEDRLAAAVSEAARGLTARPGRAAGSRRAGGGSDTGLRGRNHGDSGFAGPASGGSHPEDQGPGGSGGPRTDHSGGRTGTGSGDSNARDGSRDGVGPAPLDLPGPTGESNRLSFAPRGVVLCLGPGAAAASAQITAALDAGNTVVAVADGVTGAFAPPVPDPRVVLLDGQIAPDSLVAVHGIAAVACGADRKALAAMRAALARRPGPIVALITESDAPERYVLERHVCVDTTAAGGNASLLAEAEAET